MMRFGKRDDAVDLSDSVEGQRSNTYQTTPTTEQQLEGISADQQCCVVRQARML